VALGADRLDDEADQRQLDQHQVALQVGEARAGEPRPGLHVDQAELGADVEVVARLEVEARHLPHCTQNHRVLLDHPVGRVVVGDVRQRQGQLAQRPLDRLQLLSPGVDRLAQAADRGDLRVGVATLAFDLADPLRGGVALRLSVLDLRQQLAPARVEGQQLVDLAARAAAGQSRLYPLGFGAEQLEVEHRAGSTVRPGRFPRRGEEIPRLRCQRTWRRISPPLRLPCRRRYSAA